MILGNLKKVDKLNTIWNHEAHDFTTWLCQDENLELLGNALNLDIELVERESNVGRFSVDIHAIELGSGKNIIIENQLRETDHDHLGKIITYAAGKDASYIIWIVGQVREEHKSAIEWLNTHTDESIDFILVEIEALQIDDSKPAIRFNVVKSRDPQRRQPRQTKNVTELNIKQLDFWQRFKGYALNNNEFKQIFSSMQKPQPRSWYDLSVGNPNLHIAFMLNSKKKIVRAGLYIKNNKYIYDKLLKQCEDIKNKFGIELIYHMSRKDSYIYTEKNIHDLLDNKDNDCLKWLCTQAITLSNIAKTI